MYSKFVLPNWNGSAIHTKWVNGPWQTNILSSNLTCDNDMILIQEYKVPEVHAEADGEDQLIRLVS